jgi:hypothetical protein
MSNWSGIFGQAGAKPDGGGRGALVVPRLDSHHMPWGLDDVDLPGARHCPSVSSIFHLPSPLNLGPIEL